MSHRQDRKALTLRLDPVRQGRLQEIAAVLKVSEKMAAVACINVTYDVFVDMVEKKVKEAALAKAQETEVKSDEDNA